MSRRRRAEKRFLISDVKYNNLKIAKLINMIMMKGKKTVAEAIVYNALEKAAHSSNQPVDEMVEKVLDLIGPKVELKSKRVGGATYQIPFEVNPDRRLTLALRLLIKHSRLRQEKTMWERLAGEMTDALANRGGAIKEKDNIYKMAESNKAFAHLRFAA